MEIWKSITDYNGFYEVSNYGNIRRLANSARCLKTRQLVIKYKPNGYAFVCLSVNNRQTYHHVHRLVGFAFIANPHSKPCINHKDGNKKNNHHLNLEWVTKSENMRHALKTGLWIPGYVVRGELNKRAKRVAQLSLTGELLYVWGCMTDVSRHYNISASSIHQACKKRGTCINYQWRRISDDDYFANKQRGLPPPFTGFSCNSGKNIEITKQYSGTDNLLIKPLM